MHDLVDADIWTSDVSDYSAVTAFKLTAQEGAVLAGQTSFQVRIPVRTPSAFDADSMAFLHGKTDTEQDSGTASYLEAINAFGFKTDQTPAEKTSNNVWARVPFAGFCVRKIDGARRTGLAGAEFALKDADGRVICTAVSDSEGLFQFRELTEGVYTLTETKAPDGYIASDISVTVTIRQSNVTMDYRVSFSAPYSGAGTLSVPLQIENFAVYKLPETGGAGLWGCYALGGFLLLAAALGLLIRRKHNASRD